MRAADKDTGIEGHRSAAACKKETSVLLEERAFHHESIFHAVQWILTPVVGAFIWTTTATGAAQAKGASARTA
jgi:hypothetical protein